MACTEVHRRLVVAALVVAPLVALLVWSTATVRATGDYEPRQPSRLGSVVVSMAAGAQGDGYVLNSYGGLNSGVLPGALFADEVPRPPSLTTMSAGGVLTLGGGAGQFKSDLQWLGVQVRDHTGVVATGYLWNGTANGNRLTLSGLGSLPTTGHVALDFYDVVGEALEASPGGRSDLVIQAAAVDAGGIGVQPAQFFRGTQIQPPLGAVMKGSFPGEWFMDGQDREVSGVNINASRVQLTYQGTSGEWVSDPNLLRHQRLSVYRGDEQLIEVDLGPVLGEMTQNEIHCGGGNVICFEHGGLSGTILDYRGILLVKHEDTTALTWIRNTPGGVVAGQLMCALVAAVIVSRASKGMRSPQREWAIMGVAGIGACAFPIAGEGSLFWGVGILILCLAAGGGWHWLSRSR